MALDVAVAAVMVGQQQAPVGDQFSRAAASEEHHGVFQGCLVDAVDVFSGEPASFAAHVVYTFCYQGGKPHSFVGAGAWRKQRNENQGDNYSFHTPKMLKNIVFLYVSK